MPKPVKKIRIEYNDGTTDVFIPDPTGVSTPSQPLQKATNIGINLEPVSYWMAARPFNDLAKQMQPWVSSKVGGWGGGGILTLDSDGWLVAIPSGSMVHTQVQTSRSVPSGVYTFQPTDGVSFGGAAGIWEKKSAEQTALARITKPIKSLSLTAGGSGLFHPTFTNRLLPFNTLRFMDWGQTNIDRSISWSARTTPATYTQADKEVCLEYQMELCKQTNSAIWYCVHHRADDAYVRECAKLFKANWGGLPIYLEHSNEVWNGQFPQYHYGLARSTFNHPIEYHIKRTAQIARIFRSEGVPVISVLGLHSAGHSTSEYFINKMSGLPTDIDAVAIAPYFGGRGRISAGAIAAGVDAVLNECDADLVRVKADIAANLALANKYGKSLLGYEGGQHLVPDVAEQNNTTLVNLFITCNRSPRMYDLYRKYLAIWDEVTSKSLFCLFNDTYKPSKHGSWGLQEWDSQPLSEAHKMRAVLDHIKG